MGRDSVRRAVILPFQLERAAQEPYPDVYGGEQPFDRQRVADVADGEFQP